MSLVVLVLFGIVLFNMVRGYQRGVLMVLYSIAAWVVILIAANGLAPRVKDFMVNHTGIYHSIEQSCEKTINDRLSQSVDEQLDHTGEDTAGVLQNQGIYLPKQMVEQLENNMAQAGNKIVQESGIAQYAAEYITQFILTGISYFLTVLVLSILLGIVKRMFIVANHIPILGGVNRILGLLLGLVQYCSGKKRCAVLFGTVGVIDEGSAGGSIYYCDADLVRFAECGGYDWIYGCISNGLSGSA